MERQRLTVALLALGGQGGGVLADWLIALGETNGYYVQGTSVPGVAQRTGATVYYLEFFPETAVPVGHQPVLALMPVPGDVDLVVASELMEGGRAMLRGFVSRDRTTLITSTHRIYAISEKSAMAGGLANGEKILEAARQRAKKLVAFDMDAASDRTGSVISAVMFGAIAGSGTLPFAREQFEAAIRAGGKAIETNLAGFAAGYEAAHKGVTEAEASPPALPQPTTAAGQRLHGRVTEAFPEPVHHLALEGVKRLMDYQDAAYAGLYLDRLARILAVDDGANDWDLTREAARYLALWMSYEDTIRVADLKTRATRIERVRAEVKAQPGQLIDITEFMHPRWQEVCETLPSGLGRALLGSRRLTRWASPLFKSGRHVTTTKLGWFLLLNLLAGMRRWRRSTLRYAVEQARIENWLTLVCEATEVDRAAARELVECQRLVKGYGDTHERGLRNFGIVTDAWKRVRGRPDAAAILRRLREAALEDEQGISLQGALQELRLAA